MNHRTISSVIVEHCEEAIFLWTQRACAICAPNYSPAQFADLDERLAAHIDGLRTAGDEGFKIAEKMLDDESPEDFFPAAVLALEANGRRFDELVHRASNVPEVLPGLISALGWVSFQYFSEWVKSFLEDEAPINQKLGICACAMHRRDLGQALNSFLMAPADSVRIRAFRAAGELGRKDTLLFLLSALEEVKPEARFWAAWSGVLLGDRDRALKVLSGLAFDDGPLQFKAFVLALQAMPMNMGHTMVQKLTGISNAVRFRIIGSGVIGSIRYVPWLMEQMENPTLARIAAEAFVNITGADFNLAQLETEPPEQFDAGPTEDPDDEIVEVSEDIALPWPDVEKIHAWWTKYQARFQINTRYFIGQPITRENCMNVLKEGFQRQRIMAAQHLCLLKPGTVLFPTTAPAWRQKRWLGKLPSNWI